MKKCNLRQDNRGASKILVVLIVLAVLGYGIFSIVLPEIRNKMVTEDTENVTKLTGAIKTALDDPAVKETVSTAKEGAVTQLVLEDIYFTKDGSKDTPLNVSIRKQLGDDFPQRLKSTKKNVIIIIRGYPWIFNYEIYADEVAEQNQLYPNLNYKFYDAEESETTDASSAD